MATLARVDRGLAAAMYALVGMYLAPRNAGTSLSMSRSMSPTVSQAVIGCLVVALLTWYGNIINDVADVPVDALSKPERAIPSGAVTATFATTYALCLTGVALLLAAWLGAWPLAIAVGAWLLATAYSFLLKSTLLAGNASVGVCVAGTLVFGGVVAGGVTPSIMVGAAMAGLYVTAQEVLFNVEDEHGDRAGGLTTTATRLGRRGALRLYRMLMVCFVLVACVPERLAGTSRGYLPMLIVCIGVPAMIVLLLLARPDDRSIARAVRISRVAWVLGALPLLLLRT